jgi:hypothetical protein
MATKPEPVFGAQESIPPFFAARACICKRLWSPGIDSKESMPLAYVAWRAGTKYRVVVPVRQAGNRFLASFKGLQIRALEGRHDKYSWSTSRPGNRFLGSLEALQIGALMVLVQWNRFLGSL